MEGYAAGTRTQELIDVAPTPASEGQPLSQPSSGQVADETHPTPDPNVGRQPEPTPEEAQPVKPARVRRGGRRKKAAEKPEETT